VSESIVYCEGYHDRAFWKGWLEHLGCSDPGLPPPGRTGRIAVYDPWSTEVKGGQFAYLSRSKHFVRVVPCGGKTKVLPAARSRLKQRTSKALVHLIINIDADLTAGGTAAGATGLQRRDVEQFARTFDPAAAVNADGEIEIDGGATRICLVRWEAPEPPTRGLPDQQTLERLVSAVLAGAYPARPLVVQDWLDKRPGPPGADPKEHAWSYMAGWYAEHGCEAFYSNLWTGPLVAAELEIRLKTSGAWKIATALAG
jgi:hypothetical protein